MKQLSVVFAVLAVTALGCDTAVAQFGPPPMGGLPRGAMAGPPHALSSGMPRGGGPIGSGNVMARGAVGSGNIVGSGNVMINRGDRSFAGAYYGGGGGRHGYGGYGGYGSGYYRPNAWAAYAAGATTGAAAASSYGSSSNSSDGYDASSDDTYYRRYYSRRSGYSRSDCSQ